MQISISIWYPQANGLSQSDFSEKYVLLWKIDLEDDLRESAMEFQKVTVVFHSSRFYIWSYEGEI